jgi:hypothetical protein
MRGGRRRDVYRRPPNVLAREASDADGGCRRPIWWQCRGEARWRSKRLREGFGAPDAMWTRIRRGAWLMELKMVWDVWFRDCRHTVYFLATVMWDSPICTFDSWLVALSPVWAGGMRALSGQGFLYWFGSPGLQIYKLYICVCGLTNSSCTFRFFSYLKWFIVQTCLLNMLRKAHSLSSLTHITLVFYYWRL